MGMREREEGVLRPPIVGVLSVLSLVEEEWIRKRAHSCI